MATSYITALGDRYVKRIVISTAGPCRHFSIEMDGDLQPWATEPEFICTDCRTRLSRDQAIAIREMHEIRT